MDCPIKNILKRINSLEENQGQIISKSSQETGKLSLPKFLSSSGLKFALPMLVMSFDIHED